MARQYPLGQKQLIQAAAAKDIGKDIVNQLNKKPHCSRITLLWGHYVLLILYVFPVSVYSLILKRNYWIVTISLLLLNLKKISLILILMHL